MSPAGLETVGQVCRELGLTPLPDEVEEFVIGARHGPQPDRVLATVLLADIVEALGAAEREAIFQTIDSEVAAEALSEIDPKMQVSILESLERHARAADPRVKQVIGRLSGEYDVVLMARADGGLAADVRPLVHLSITVIAEQDGRREQGHLGAGGRTG